MFDNFLSKIFRIKRTIIVTPRSDQQLNRAVEFERGRLQGEALREKKEKEELQQKISGIEDNYVKESPVRLNLRKEELDNENLIGGCDWKELFSELAKKKKKFKIKVFSYNLKKDFGYFDRLVTDSKGMINLFVNENGIKKRIMTGSKFSHIFRFPYGIAKMANRKMFIVNLDENGNYLSDPLYTEIPDLVIDKDGKYSLSEADMEPFIDRYIKVNAQLSESHAHIETLEKTMSEMIRKENLTKHQLNVAKSRADTAESELSLNIKKISEMHENFSNAVNRTTNLSQQLDIVRDQNKVFEDTIINIMGKLEEAKSTTRLEDTKAMLEDAMEIIDRFRPASQEIIVEPKEQGKFDKSLEKLKEKGENF